MPNMFELKIQIICIDKNDKFDVKVFLHNTNTNNTFLIAHKTSISNKQTKEIIEQYYELVITSAINSNLLVDVK